MTQFAEKVKVTEAYLKIIAESRDRDADLDRKTCWTTADEWKKDEYVQKFRNHLGCRDDYWPDDVTYRKSMDDIANEYALEQPFDTAAREKECTAVMLLIRNGTENSIEMAHKLGDCIMENKSGKDKLLDLLQKTFIELLHCSHWDANEKTDDAGRDD